MDTRAQLDFVWLFAILAGGAILALAIYGATQFAGTEASKQNTQTAKQLTILIDPLQAGFGEGKFSSISFNQETRINNECESREFGKHRISTSARSAVNKEWEQEGIQVSIANKYIFSSETSSGKEFYVFSEPFKFPYKVSDLISITSKTYCFIDAPEDIEQTFENAKNIEVGTCTNPSALRVCFEAGRDCDIRVAGDSGSGTITKEGENTPYVEGLFYAALVSDEDIYECNVKRLLYRASKIAENFAQKADIMSLRDCKTNLKSDLVLWGGQTSNATLRNLQGLLDRANELELKNKHELCGVWE